MAVDASGRMMPSTPYSLPYAVLVQPGLAAAGKHDVTVRVVTGRPPSRSTARALGATLLPFLLLLDSGALAGAAIPPWTSGIEDWTEAQLQASSVEWTLTAVTCDPQAWVVLAQMLMVDHGKHPIARVEVADARQPDELIEVVQGASRVNPYPRRWSGIAFAVEFDDELDSDFTVCVGFVRPLTADEQERVSEALFAWAPGLVNGAYGVAPVPPDSCAGMPDRKIVFVDTELEWIIRRFRAHSGAIEGLINVVAAVSSQVVPVTEFRIE